MQRSIRLGLRLESKICLSLRRLTLDIPNDILDLNIMLGQTQIYKERFPFNILVVSGLIKNISDVIFYLCN